MKTSGFSVPEMMLTVSAIAIIAAIGIPVYERLNVRNELEIAKISLAQSYRRAIVLAQAQVGDMAHGVYVATGTITVFRGNSYATRDPSYDETFTFPDNITHSGLLEMVFAKFTGRATTTGTTTLTSLEGWTRSISVSSESVVSF